MSTFGISDDLRSRLVDAYLAALRVWSANQDVRARAQVVDLSRRDYCDGYVLAALHQRSDDWPGDPALNVAYERARFIFVDEAREGRG